MKFGKIMNEDQDIIEVYMEGPRGYTGPWRSETVDKILSVQMVRLYNELEDYVIPYVEFVPTSRYAKKWLSGVDSDPNKQETRSAYLDCLDDELKKRVESFMCSADFKDGKLISCSSSIGRAPDL